MKKRVEHKYTNEHNCKQEFREHKTYSASKQLLESDPENEHEPEDVQRQECAEEELVRVAGRIPFAHPVSLEERCPDHAAEKQDH